MNLSRASLQVIIGYVWLTPLLMMFNVAIQAAEPDWAMSISLSSPSTKIEQLDAANKKIYSLLKQQGTKEAAGHVLILHGARQNPDWKDVIRPLRLALPDYGWASLSIEMPAIPVDATEKDYAALLEQATASILSAQGYLQDAGAKRIVLIGYGLGARMAVDWLSKTPQSSVKALVMISMADGELNAGIDTNQDLLNIRIPKLDIYAEHDSSDVVKAATERYRNRNRLAPYRQLVMFSANQYYSQQNDELIKRLRGWLKHTFQNNKL